MSTKPDPRMIQVRTVVSAMKISSPSIEPISTNPHHERGDALRHLIEGGDRSGGGKADLESPTDPQSLRTESQRMHLHPEHAEKHFTASDTVRDVVVGMSDGLTVPFALAAGISGAIAVSHLVVTAGLAEIAAGSIAMGLGGYLAGRSETEHYMSERRREEAEVKSVPEIESREVQQIFESYGITADESASVVDALTRRPGAWVDFMMRFELGLEKPDPRRAMISAATIGGSYAVGGIVPLGPYFFVSDAHSALFVSAAVTVVALGIFGFVKGRFSGARPIVSAAQTVVIGGLAASAAFLLARAIA